jgi:chromosome partitioning protein
MIVSIANQKGGAGKSTVALSIAGEWARRGLRVLLVDGDSQGTALTSVAQGADSDPASPRPMAVAMPNGRAIMRQVPTLARNYDRVVIDTTGRINDVMGAALAVADLVLIPVSYGGAETWALASTFDVIERVRAIKPSLKVAMMLNRMKRNKMASTLRPTLEGTDYSVLRATFSDRIAFVEALTAGKTATLYEPDGAAAKEVMRLVEELEALFPALKAA